MEKAHTNRPVWVGLFVLVGILFLIAGILMIGNLHETFKRKIQVFTLFDDVNGLQAGNNIWFSGVKIGTVSKLKFYSKSRVEVTMKVETNAQQYIHQDAMVKIGSDGLIGNRILVIYGGTSSFPPVKEGDTLHVEKAISTEDMMSMLQENNKNLLAITSDFKQISKSLASGEGSVGKLLKDETLYNNMNSAAVSLRNASGNADHMTASLRQFSDGLSKKGTLANDLATDTMVFRSVRQSALQLKQLTGNANAMIEELQRTSRNPKTALGVLLYNEKAGDDLQTTFKNLATGSAKLDDDLEAAQHSIFLRGYFKKKMKQEQIDLKTKSTE